MGKTTATYCFSCDDCGYDALYCPACVRTLAEDKARDAGAAAMAGVWRNVVDAVGEAAAGANECRTCGEPVYFLRIKPNTSKRAWARWYIFSLDGTHHACERDEGE